MANPENINSSVADLVSETRARIGKSLELLERTASAAKGDGVLSATGAREKATRRESRADGDGGDGTP